MKTPAHTDAREGSTAVSAPRAGSPEALPLDPAVLCTLTRTASTFIRCQLEPERQPCLLYLQQASLS